MEALKYYVGNSKFVARTNDEHGGLNVHSIASLSETGNYISVKHEYEYEGKLIKAESIFSYYDEAHGTYLCHYISELFSCHLTGVWHSEAKVMSWLGKDDRGNTVTGTDTFTDRGVYHLRTYWKGNTPVFNHIGTSKAPAEV